MNLNFQLELQLKPYSMNKVGKFKQQDMLLRMYRRGQYDPFLCKPKKYTDNSEGYDGEGRQYFVIDISTQFVHLAFEDELVSV